MITFSPVGLNDELSFKAKVGRIEKTVDLKI